MRRVAAATLALLSTGCIRREVVEIKTAPTEAALKRAIVDERREELALRQDMKAHPRDYRDHFPPRAMIKACAKTPLSDERSKSLSRGFSAADRLQVFILNPRLLGGQLCGMVNRIPDRRPWMQWEYEDACMPLQQLDSVIVRRENWSVSMSPAPSVVETPTC